MAQTTILVKCIDQALVPTTTPIIAAGGVEEDKIIFDFCPLWVGFTKKVVFKYNETCSIEIDIDADNSCVIPTEVVAQPGIISFGVYGTNDVGIRRTSTVIEYIIAKGATSLL